MVEETTTWEKQSQEQHQTFLNYWQIQIWGLRPGYLLSSFPYSSSLSSSSSTSSFSLTAWLGPASSISICYLPVLNQPSRKLTITNGWRSMMAQGFACVCICVCMPPCMLTCLYVIILAGIGIQCLKTCGKLRVRCFTPFYMWLIKFSDCSC